MSKTYKFKTVQTIPVSLQTAWEFFSNPANLQVITPDQLGFNIISKYHGTKMYPGQLIEYTLKPLLGIPVYWMTEITHVEEGNYFVDEQRYGPYSLWHHQHHFKETPAGIEMTDIVHYKIPFWFLGDIAHSIFIRKKLEEIFYPGDPLPLYLDKKSETLRIIQQLRDEVHRFGITHHRNKRSKGVIKTGLSEIKGIGEATAEALLRHFRSVKRIKEAGFEELVAVVGTAKGKIVFDHFKNESSEL